MDLMKSTRNNIFIIGVISILFISILLSSCGEKIKKEIVEKYPNGSTKLERFFIKTNDSLEKVKEIYYYEDKKTRVDGEFKKGKRYGKWTYWYPNGNKWSEGYFKNGISDSIRTTYYENGKKRYEGYYKDGEQIGIWKFWFEDGSVAEERDYSKK